MTNFLISKGRFLMKSLLKTAVTFGVMFAVLASGNSLVLGFSQSAIAPVNQSASYQIAAASDVVRERAKDEFEDKTSPEARRQLERAVQEPQGKVRRDLNRAEHKAERAVDRAQGKAERGMNRAERAAERAKSQVEDLFD